MRSLCLSENSIRDTIRNFINSNFMLNEELRRFSDSDSFLRKGIIDSMGVVELLGFVQKRYKIRIEPAEVLPQNFDTLENLDRYIQMKLESQAK